MSVCTAIDHFANRVRCQIERHLTEALSGNPSSEVYQAAQYLVLGGGHRWRGLVTIASGLIFDPDAFEIAMPAACSAELAHAASLVLDDLPSMDNAELRRGKPCVHKVFSRSAVDMLPVFLVTLAYRLSLDNPRVSHQRRVAAALDMSCAGIAMLRGQEMDLSHTAQEPSPEKLRECYRLKSGTLYSAAGKTGAILCGASEEEARIMESFGMNLGVSYQLMDDLADVRVGLEELGKHPGADCQKFTGMNRFGENGIRCLASELKSEALDMLDRFGQNADLLRQLVGQIGWTSLT